MCPALAAGACGANHDSKQIEGIVMEALLASTLMIALAEVGDKTQFATVALAAHFDALLRGAFSLRYRRPSCMLVCDRVSAGIDRRSGSWLHVPRVPAPRNGGAPWTRYLTSSTGTGDWWTTFAATEPSSAPANAPRP